jgi:demethylmenaquinone methyltransferase/2-methoxy-6-polyprenyl-1,4-benzoquinol methylase
VHHYNHQPPYIDNEVIPLFSRWIGAWRISVERKPYERTELATRYNGIADSWQHKLTRLGVTDDYRDIANHLADSLVNNAASAVAPLRAPVNLIDCGAGTAALSLHLAHTSRIPLHVSLVDISSAMLQQAGRLFTDAELPVALHQSDIRDIPLADNSQDLAIATHVLEHLANPAVAFRELYRVLKPGAVALVSCTRNSLPGKWIQMKWRTHALTPSSLKQWLVESGFEQIEAVPLSRHSSLKRFSLVYTARKPEPHSLRQVAA